MNRKAFVPALAFLGLVAASAMAPAPASATTNTASETPGNSSPVVCDGTCPPSPPSDYVKFYLSVANNATTATNNLVGYQGPFNLAVAVLCQNPVDNNINQSSTGSAIVACQWFASSITQGQAAGTSY